MKLSIVSIMAVLALVCLGQANAHDEQALRGSEDANLQASRDLLGEYMEDFDEEDFDEEDFDEENRELFISRLKNRLKKAMCYQDKQCKGGLKCSHHKIRVGGKDRTIGVCTDGKNGSPCLIPKSCKSKFCALGFRRGKIQGKCMPKGAPRYRGNGRNGE